MLLDTITLLEEKVIVVLEELKTLKEKQATLQKTLKGMEGRLALWEEERETIRTRIEKILKEVVSYQSSRERGGPPA